MEVSWNRANLTAISKTRMADDNCVDVFISLAIFLVVFLAIVKFPLQFTRFPNRQQLPTIQTMRLGCRAG